MNPCRQFLGSAATAAPPRRFLSGTTRTVPSFAGINLPRVQVAVRVRRWTAASVSLTTFARSCCRPTGVGRYALRLLIEAGPLLFCAHSLSFLCPKSLSWLPLYPVRSSAAAPLLRRPASRQLFQTMLPLSRYEEKPANMPSFTRGCHGSTPRGARSLAVFVPGWSALCLRGPKSGRSTFFTLDE